MSSDRKKRDPWLGTSAPPPTSEAAEERPQAPAREAGSGVVLVAALAGAIAGGAAGFIGARWEVPRQIEARLEGIAPPVIFDVARYAEAAPAGGPEGPAAHAERLIQQYRDAGYLVLDGSAVLAAPETLYVEPRGDR